MKIIKSLYIYNSYLFISYLEGEVDVIPLLLNYKYYNYKRNIYIKEFKNVVSNSFVGISNQLYYIDKIMGLTSLKLEHGEISYNPGSFDLITPNLLKFNFDRKSLFGLNQKGISEINLKSKQPLVKNYFDLSSANKTETTVISNIEFQKDNFLVSVRNFGIESLNYTTKTSKIVRFDDPQDLKVLGENSIVIADSVRGLLLYDIKNREIIKTLKLPIENDYPQQIEYAYNMIIIKGNKGLYFYSIRDRKFLVVLDQKIGALISYYREIYFSKKGKVYCIKISDPHNIIQIHPFDRDK